MYRSYAQGVGAKPKVEYYSNATQTDFNTSSTTLSSQPQGFQRLSFAERKAALNLTQLARSHGEKEKAWDADTITNLIETLTAEAPDSVEKLVTDSEKTTANHGTSEMTEAEASSTKASSNEGREGPLSDEEKKDLEALIELAQRRLQSTTQTQENVKQEREKL